MAISQKPAEHTNDGAIELKVCEAGNDVCAIWTFSKAGGQPRLGTGQWRTGEVASLSYSIEGSQTKIERVDSTGPSAGLIATYTGTEDSDGLAGSFTSSWPGHYASKTGHWYATPAPPIALPTIMHFCQANCFTLTLDNGRYQKTPKYPWEPANSASTWMVESFTRQSVVIRRHESWLPKHPNGWDMVYKGQISGDGYNVVNITDNGTPTDRIRIGWGEALKMIPGDNMERDRLGGQVVINPPCDVDCLLKWAQLFNQGLELWSRLKQ